MKETKWQRADRYAKRLIGNLESHGATLENVGHAHVAKVAFRDGVEAGRRDARREYGMSRATATKLLALAQERKRLLDKRSNTALTGERSESELKA
jgi:hypothetical protein